MNMDVIMQRIESKLDDLRDMVHAINVSSAETKVRQDAIEIRLRDAENELAALKSAHDKIVGVLKVLSIPSVASFIWAAIQLMQK